MEKTHNQHSKVKMPIHRSPNAVMGQTAKKMQKLTNLVASTPVNNVRPGRNTWLSRLAVFPTFFQRFNATKRSRSPGSKSRLEPSRTAKHSWTAQRFNVAQRETSKGKTTAYSGLKQQLCSKQARVGSKIWGLYPQKMWIEATKNGNLRHNNRIKRSNRKHGNIKNGDMSLPRIHLSPCRHPPA